MADPFLSWGIAAIEAAATLLEAEIADARRGNRSSLSNYEALYVHFRDAKVEQPLAIWLYATREGAAYNVGRRRTSSALDSSTIPTTNSTRGPFGFGA